MPFFEYLGISEIWISFSGMNGPGYQRCLFGILWHTKLLQRLWNLLFSLRFLIHWRILGKWFHLYVTQLTHLEIEDDHTSLYYFETYWFQVMNENSTTFIGICFVQCLHLDNQNSLDLIQRDKKRLKLNRAVLGCMRFFFSYIKFFIYRIIE